MENAILDDNLVEKEDEIIEPRYAGFWIRTLASFLDALIMMPLGLFGIFAIIYYNNLPLYVFCLIISACYKPYCEYKLGATLGKMVIDLKVVNKDFQQISFEQSLIRSSLFLINSIVSIIFILFIVDADSFDNINGFFEFVAMNENLEYSWLNNLGTWPVFISCLVVAFHKKKQGLHDQLAKTYCIYKN